MSPKEKPYRLTPRAVIPPAERPSVFRDILDDFAHGKDEIAEVSVAGKNATSVYQGLSRHKAKRPEFGGVQVQQRGDRVFLRKA